MRTIRLDQKSSLAYYRRKTSCYSGFAISPETLTTIYLWMFSVQPFPCCWGSFVGGAFPNTWYVALDHLSTHSLIFERWHFDQKKRRVNLCLLQSFMQYWQHYIDKHQYTSNLSMYINWSCWKKSIWGAGAGKTIAFHLEVEYGGWVEEPCV